MDKYYYVSGGSDYLEHHGILGQKWGVRRFQNPDGTYTSVGKERRRRSDSYSDDYKKYRQSRKKSTKDLSTKDIEEMNRRDNAINNYNRNHASIGKQWIDKYGQKIMEKSAEAVAVATIAAGAAIVRKILRGS